MTGRMVADIDFVRLEVMMRMIRDGVVVWRTDNGDELKLKDVSDSRLMEIYTKLNNIKP